MADRNTSNNETTPVPRWRLRLVEGRWTLSAVALVAVFLMLSGAVAPVAALFGFLLVICATIFLSRDVERSRPATEDSALIWELREQAAMRFADTLSDPCFILDRKAHIIHHNSPARKQFSAATIGNPLAFSLRDPGLLSAIDSVIASGRTEAVELHQSVPTETWFAVTISPLDLEKREDGTGPSDRIVVLLHNLTEQKRVEAMRADFIANASHELRTPLTSLIGFIDTLRGPAANDAEARERFLGIMRGQSERMSNLVDDLLSLSRIEMRQHVRPTGKVDLRSILAEVVDGLQNQSREAGVKISVQTPDEPVMVLGDREELYEAFENLTDNAIKYGADGELVEINLVESTRVDYDYEINIVDHGPGIDAEHVPRLTERFYRVDAESSRKKKGTGLGLAIVKHILSRHGGLMTIRSSVGVGTRVEILLKK